MPIRTRCSTVILCSAAVLAVAAPASAGPPVREHLDFTFVSTLLTGACGVEVTQHLRGYYSTVTTGGRTLTNFHFRSTLTAGERVVESRAFGPTLEVAEADGSLTITTLGVTMRNLPGSGTAGPFAGRQVVLVPLEGDEVVLHDSGYRQDLDELCAALTA